MKLGDVLAATGQSVLKGHSWTQGLLDTLNLAIPAAQLLTGDSTGHQATMLLNTLPVEDRVKFLMANVDLVTGTVSYDTGVASTQEAVDKSNTPLSDLTRNPRSIIALMLGLAMVFVALLLAGAMTIVTIRTGHVPDSAALKEILHLLADIIKALSDADPSTTDPAHAASLFLQ